MTQPIRLGIAGTGRMAGRMMQALAHLPDVRVQSVASGDAARARAFADTFGVADAAGSVADMARDNNVDAVYVAGRTRDHAAAAMAAIEAGKPALVEKPLAVSPAEAQDLINRAGKKNSLLVENLWCLSLPSYRALHDQLISGSHGVPVHLHFDFGYPVQPDSYPSLFDSEDGGAIRDRGVYGVSLAIKMLGPVRHVTCAAQLDETGVDLVADMRLVHESGAISQIAVSLNALMSNTASIACTHGHLGLADPVIGSENLTSTQMLPQAAMPALSGVQTGLVQRIKAWPAARRLKRRRDMSPGRFLSYGADPYLPMLSHFRDLVRAGKTQSDLVPLSLSLATQDILHTARNQAIEG